MRGITKQSCRFVSAGEATRGASASKLQTIALLVARK